MARPACTLSHLACVASVSVRFRSKVSFLARSKPKVSFHDLFLLRNQTETLATQAVPPGTWTQKSSLKRLRTKTFYTPSSQLKDSRIWMGFKSSFEMANCCRQNSKMNFNACNKTGDESQQSCKQNIVVRHFELESFHLRLDPSIWCSWHKKCPVSVVHANSPNLSD